jgi:hypothetical protein
MRLLFSSIFTVTLAGIAFAQTGPGAQDRAKDAYSGCLMRAALSIDDQMSSPAALAREILQICHLEFDNVVSTYTHGVTRKARATVRAKAMADPSYQDNAEMAIEEVRRRRP